MLADVQEAYAKFEPKQDSPIFCCVPILLTLSDDKYMAIIVTLHHEAPHPRNPKQINALPTVREAETAKVVSSNGFALLVKNFRKIVECKKL